MRIKQDSGTFHHLDMGVLPSPPPPPGLFIAWETVQVTVLYQFGIKFNSYIQVREQTDQECRLSVVSYFSSDFRVCGAACAALLKK